MPKFAANLSLMFTELPLLERFGAARAHGFDAVELQFPYAVPADAIAARLRRHRLRLVMHNLPCGNWEAGERGLACDPAKVAQFRDSVALGIAYARALGVDRLHCMAGNLPPGVAPAAARLTYVANLRYAAAALRRHGLCLLIEPIKSFDLPDYFLTGSAQAAAVIADCGADNLFLQYDLYHMERMEGALAATIAALFPLIGHVQLADVPGRHEPGTGNIAFAPLFRLLDELGYTGWIGCEYLPLHGTAAGLGWRARMT